jgi:hypothetical protein
MTGRTGCLNWARPDLWEARLARAAPTRPLYQLPLAESCWRRAYLSASDLQRNDIRRMMGLPDQTARFSDGLDK